MKRLIILLTFLSSTAFAQAPVVVTGTVTDAGGNPATSGYVQFDIQPKSSSIQYFVSGVAAVAPQTVQCGITPGGLLQNITLTGPCNVWGNDVITPANTTYKVTFAAGGIVSNVVNAELITGSSYNLNSPVFAPIVQTTPQQGTITANPFQVNILPSANGVFNIGSPLMQYANGYFSHITLNGSSVPAFGTSNIWTGTNTFTSGITGTGTIGTLGLGPTALGANNTFTGTNIFGHTVFSDVVSFNPGYVFVETNTPPANFVGTESCYGNIVNHAVSCSYNGDAFANVVRVIASGQTFMPTAAIGAGTCTPAQITTGLTGVTVNDVISWSFNNTTVGAGVLFVQNAAGTNQVFFQYCNATAGTLTPGAATINWKVIR